MTCQPALTCTIQRPRLLTAVLQKGGFGSMKAHLHGRPGCQQRLLGPSAAARCFPSMRRRSDVHASVDTDGNSVRMRTLDLPGAPGPVRLDDRNSNGNGAQMSRQSQAQSSRVGTKAWPAPGSPSQQHVQQQQQDLLNERRSSNGAASTREPAAGRATPAHRSTGNGAGPKPRQAAAATSGIGRATQQALGTDITTGASMGPTVPASSSMAQPATAQRAPPSQASDAALSSGAALTAPLSGNRAPGMLASDFDAPVEIRFDDNYRWSRESYNKTRRSIDIWSFILALRFKLWQLDQKWSYAGGMTPVKKAERQRSTAIWCREQLLQLGPTFIKVGQLFSSRSDLFPAAFTEELSKLQDRVPAFNPKKAIAIVEAEFGAPVSQLYRSFEELPLAAASLGQVHRAVLHSGEEVVVKIQRPGLKALFDIDLANLKVVAQQLDRKEDSTTDFVGVWQEYNRILYEEIDYVNEGRNANRFQRNFRPDPLVKIPTVHWQLTSPRVITLTYMPGIKITNVAALKASGLNGAAVARRATEAYLVQILQHGFLHSDPHPGNIAVGPNEELIWYDFGMMSQLQVTTKERLLELFYGVAQKDAGRVIVALQALGIIVAQGDTLSLKRAITYFLNNIARQTQEQETIGAIGEDIFAVALDQPFRFPATFTFVLRAFSTLEGIGRVLDPDYKFTAVATPYAQQLLELQDGSAQRTFALDEVRKQATQVGADALAMPGRVERISATLNSLEAGDTKLRVRALEVERAAKRASVMQMVTIQSISVAACLNIGTQLALSGRVGISSVPFIASAVSGFLVYSGLRRVKRIDKFNKNITG